MESGIFIGFMAGGLGFLKAYFEKPVYTATISFVLEDEKSSRGGGISGISSDLASLAGVVIAILRL